MRRVINGKVYDTETATRVDYYQFSGGNDFRYMREDLYVTKKGNWFIEYEGGPMSKYVVDAGNGSRCGSDGIKALTANEAYDWLEKNECTNAIEEYFSKNIEEA